MTRDKVIHCRLTTEEHAAVLAKAEAAGLSITQYVVRVLLAQKVSDAIK
jgi:predicted HicB family RNase H-like nuclease